jgi:small ubiquitin-related modifier
MSSNPVDTKPASETTHITLRVTTSTGGERLFKVKSSTLVKKVLASFCEHEGINAADVRFMFNGERLNPEDTVKLAGLEDGDVIDAMVMQVGGL